VFWAVRLIQISYFWRGTYKIGFAHFSFVKNSGNLNLPNNMTFVANHEKIPQI
jgi:hypothetical protein